VVDDAIRFVATSESEKSKEKIKLFSNISDEDDKESKEPDYNEDEKSDKKGEEMQEKETGEIALATTANQVF
jgi:hypothetical protein